MIGTVTPELPLLRMAFAILSERMGTVMSEPPCQNYIPVAKARIPAAPVTYERICGST
jgi:hypothetical protein